MLQLLLQLFYSAVKLNFGVVGAVAEQAFWVYERDILLVGSVNPKNIVRIEIAGNEEAHADFAFVAEQVY